MDAIPFSSRYTYRRKAFQISRATRPSRSHPRQADFLQVVYQCSFFIGVCLVVRLFQIVPRPIARKKEIEQRFSEVSEEGFHAITSHKSGIELCTAPASVFTCTP
jgi:dolichol kinase